jgi:hypothetical protein
MPGGHSPACVYLVLSEWTPFAANCASGKSNDRGEYGIFWLPAGEYLVAIEKDSTQVVGGSLLQQVVSTFYPGSPIVTEALPVPGAYDLFGRMPTGPNEHCFPLDAPMLANQRLENDWNARSLER